MRAYTAIVNVDLPINDSCGGPTFCETVGLTGRNSYGRPVSQQGIIGRALKIKKKINLSIFLTISPLIAKSSSKSERLIAAPYVAPYADLICTFREGHVSTNKLIGLRMLAHLHALILFIFIFSLHSLSLTHLRF